MAESLFSKRLSKTDIGKRLTVPTRVLKSLPVFKKDCHAVDFDVKDEEGRVWTFRCSTRKQKKHLKPVLSKGWREFVCKKKLQIGDEVEFSQEVEKASSNKYYVKVVRPVRLFGKVLGLAQIC